MGEAMEGTIMGLSEFTFRLLVLFLPGVLCAYVVDSLTVHRPRNAFFFLMRSFVFGTGAYATYYVLLWGAGFALRMPVDYTPKALPALVDPNAAYPFTEIAYACIWAVIIGVLFSRGSNRSWLNRRARSWGITRKFGELDVWGYMFNSPDVVWVTVRDHKNDRIFDGWLQAFSDDSREAEILLRDVSVYKNSTGAKEYQVGALYIARNRQDISIECRGIEVDEQVKWKEEERKDEQPQLTEKRGEAHKANGGNREEGRTESQADDSAPAST